VFRLVLSHSARVMGFFQIDMAFLGWRAGRAG